MSRDRKRGSIGKYEEKLDYMYEYERDRVRVRVE